MEPVQPPLLARFISWDEQSTAGTREPEPFGHGSGQAAGSRVGWADATARFARFISWIEQSTAGTADSRVGWTRYNPASCSFHFMD
jgi:hypothetical protein